jgi:hypothetical protein
LLRLIISRRNHRGRATGVVPGEVEFLHGDATGRAQVGRLVALDGPAGGLELPVNVSSGFMACSLGPPAADILDGAEGLGDSFLAAEFVDDGG